ncbi:hypothetical protein BN1708_013149 [Verticillium longisporum]|uniref:Uncharacterized protein n=1 Tax=Verticillium longisporum TaxID=100787 RepID=A0A0G4LIJ4_VERLO|nr:hypothetical protein BN1708_013149 [Verticillium longisporum]
MGYFSMSRLGRRENLILLAFSLLFTINIAVSNLSLAMVSVPFYQVLRTSVPVFTVLIYRVIFSRTYETMTGPGGYRSGSFVHPFQQTPRTSTPPLSYANSLASLDQPTQQGNNNSRDYSPTITEDEDLDFDPSYSYNHPANGLQPQSRSLSQNNLHNYAANTNTAGNTSNSSPRAGSERSVACRRERLQNQNPLRINTSNRSTSVSGGSRLANVSSTSDLNLLSESYDSPGALSLATSPPSSSTPAFSPHSFTATSPVSLSTSASAMGLRTLLEGFRLRSRSELGSDYHQERIRIERQKWQDKERAKQQKRLLFLVFAAARGDHHRTESDARDQQVEAAAEALIKARAAALDDGLDDHTFIRSDTAVESTYGGASFAEFKELPRRARSSEERRRTRKKTAAASVPRSNRGQCSVVRYSLKSVPTFAARGYASVAAQGVAFETPPRGRTAKRKTQSAWTTFTLWFKSLLLKSKRQ